MDILKEKALLEAQKQVQTNLTQEQQRELEELKVTDPDAWYQRRRQLEQQLEQQVQQKAQELYAQYQKQAKLDELKLTEEELKQKLTVLEYEEFLKTGKIPDKLKDDDKKDDDKKDDEQDDDKIPDITKVKGTDPTKSDEVKDFKKEYENLIF